MNYHTNDSLKSSIGNSTKLIEIRLKNARAIISEYGGRLLGLFPKRDCYNLLWTESNLQDLIQKNNWAIGGERYWISPERTFFYKKPQTWEDWFCPEGLDPAHYEILVSSEKSCTVSSNINIKNQFSKKILTGEITRQFTIINEPFKTGIEHCGIEIIDDCVFYEPNLEINGWTLTCVISGGLNNPGTVLIPTKSNPKPLSYFRIIPNERLAIEEEYVSFKIDVNDIYKLAIRPEDIDFSRKAKIGYVMKLPRSEEYGFLIKLSDDLPKNQDECFDIARDHPESEIGVIQSYNSESPDKSSLNFGEIELQLSPFKTIDNASHGKAIHQLMAYIGQKEEILDVIEKYLGISCPRLFK
ncbi:MAG: hypothetical protein EU539_12340 [Promethearchaeota archaeon]|nr:MAG: hypothetical protein EU539_12340 [Candidatus Lokiarchaeota archaeon]